MSLKNVFRKKKSNSNLDEPTFSKERKARRSEKKKLVQGFADSPEREIRSQMQGLLSRPAEDESLLRKPISFSSSRGRTSYGSQHTDVQGTTSVGPRITKFTSTVEHTVEPDDTWARISLKYSASIDDIKRVNKLYSHDTIFSRTVLLIPVNDENKDMLKDATKTNEHDRKKQEDEVADAVEEPTKPNFGSDFPEENTSANSGGGTAAAKSFLAKFDKDFGQAKKDAIATTKTSTLRLSSDAASFSKRELPQSSSRIGAGVKGDTTHISYQQQ
eukprot:m.208342 g.208342  ORF g.208342 m.208342 type:complete len:273 (-) comp33004_c2_seq1:137-955(-)